MVEITGFLLMKEFDINIFKFHVTVIALQVS